MSAPYNTLASLAILLASGVVIPGAPWITSQTSISGTRHVRSIPLYFEPNQGQSAPEVKFLARGPGYRVLLTATAAIFTTGVGRRPLTMNFLGANAQADISGLHERPGKTNYLLGPTRSSWQTNVPTFANVVYRALYPGIDLRFHSDREQFEYDFIVAGGADVTAISLGFDGAARLQLTTEGDLIVHTSDGAIRQARPVAYQDVGAVRRAVAAEFVLRDSRQVGFSLGPYDTSMPLVIDPEIAFSSYLGGGLADIGRGMAFDTAGNFYFTGETSSLDFPTANATPLPVDPNDPGNAFVVKVSADGSTLLYATYFGGSGNDAGLDLALDAAGRVYIVGSTNSSNFPTHNAFKSTLGGFLDGFVVQLDVAGDEFLYATYLGGGQSDGARSIAVDKFGQAYVTGETDSPDFPTTSGAFQRRLRGTFDAFVTKFAVLGTTLVYSTFLGGHDGVLGDFGTGIDVDTQGNAYVTGTTGARNFPTHRAVQHQLRGDSDAFLTKLSPDGDRLVYSTFLGGRAGDNGSHIAVDGSGHPVIVGFTLSTDFPVISAAQRRSGGFFDTFVTRFDDNGADIEFSTYLGGDGFDVPGGVAADGAGNVYVTGTTGSTDFPVEQPIQAALAGSNDAFVAVFTANRGRLVFSTYLGGERLDEGAGIAVDRAGSAYIAGVTESDLFPVIGALQPARAGSVDAFFMKIVP